MVSNRTARGPGPLDPVPDAPEAALARRWSQLRSGLPSLLYLVGWAVLFVAVGVATGWLLSRVVHDDGIGRADASLVRWLAARREPALDTATEFLTWAAETPTITVMAIVTFVGAWLAWRRWREPLLVAAAVSGEVLIFLSVTFLVDRRRPPVPQLDEAPPTSSFPSGHTAAAIAMYGALAVLASQRARSALWRRLTLVLAVAVPLLVAACRMYRGMHYLTDVLGGMLLGAGWLLVAVRSVRLGVLHRRLRGTAPESTRPGPHTPVRP